MQTLKRKLERLEHYRHYEIILLRDLERIVAALLYAVRKYAPPEKAENVAREFKVIMDNVRKDIGAAPCGR